MGKKILVLAGSPRKKGNSDRLADAFIAGASESGNEVEKVYVRDLNVGGCLGCMGYQYGAANDGELQNVFRRSLKMIGAAAVIITVLSALSARILALVFASGNEELLEMTTSAIRIYSASYLFAGFNLFGSSFFTALNNGAVSALISFLRALVLQVLFVLLLPPFLGINGIWLSIVCAEICAVAVTAGCLVRYRGKYRYWGT